MVGNSRGRFVVSVLIPVFNWRIDRLIRELSCQIVGSDLIGVVEVVVIDDCSEEEVFRENEKALRQASDSGVVCVSDRNEQNLGRSTTRNRLIDCSSGDYLIFLDADVLPDDGLFISRYLKFLNNNSADVVCGGVSYRRIVEFRETELFYLEQGRRLSVADASVRSIDPWKWIFTANVMVKRCILSDVSFDSSFSGYGYEDIEWGMRLFSRCSIDHINNSVTHLGLLDKRVYYDKMISSLDNLVRLVSLHPVDSRELRIVVFAIRFGRLPLWVLRLVYRGFEKAFFGCNDFFWLENVSFQMVKGFRAAEKLRFARRRLIC